MGARNTAAPARSGDGVRDEFGHTIRIATRVARCYDAIMFSRRELPLAFAALVRQRLDAAPQRQTPESLVWSNDTIAWQPDDPPGAKYAVLDGDRTKPGTLFTYAFWLPGGVWAPAHFHSQDAHVAVMSGTLRLGYGRAVVPSRAVAVPAGQFFIARANEPHFEGSDSPCLIIGTAMGGWTTTSVG